jgi:hypothetical protein
LLESVQRRWTSQVDGLGWLDYVSRLRVLGLFSISSRLLRSDLVKVWKSFHPLVAVYLLDIFELSRDGRTRGHALKLAVPRCHSEMKRRFICVRCVGVWNALPARAV